MPDTVEAGRDPNSAVTIGQGPDSAVVIEQGPDTAVVVVQDPGAALAVVQDSTQTEVTVIEGGQPGPPGPPGPAGDPGPPGGALLTGWWTYNSSLNPPAPPGQIRTTPDPMVEQEAVTIYIANTDADGLYYTGENLAPGGQFYLRDTQAHGWVVDITSAQRTADGASGYSTVFGIVASITGQPTKNKRVQVNLVHEPHVEEWLGGTGVPAPNLGAVGDWYLNYLTGDVYEKFDLGWAQQTNITGPPGPPGLDGGAAEAHDSFVYTQTAPSAAWIVHHNLDCFPAVTVVDSGGNTLVPDVVYLDADNLEITFGSATSGRAFLN